MLKQCIKITSTFALAGTLAFGVVGCGQQQQTSQQEQTPQQEQTSQQEQTPQQGASQSELISSEEAIKTATSYIAGDNTVSDISCDLPDGTSSPRYVVSFHYDDADYLVKVDAQDGSVWYATAIYNDGTTKDVTKTGNADDADSQQEQTDTTEE